MYCCYDSITGIRYFIVVPRNQCFQLSQLNHVNTLPKDRTFFLFFLLKITNKMIRGWLLTHSIKKTRNQYHNIHKLFLTSIIFHVLMKYQNINSLSLFLPFQLSPYRALFFNSIQLISVKFLFCYLFITMAPVIIK